MLLIEIDETLETLLFDYDYSDYGEYEYRRVYRFNTFKTHS